MATSFNSNNFSEFPPLSQKWMFVYKGHVTRGVTLSTAIGLARSHLHNDGITLPQQDAVMAIAVKQCILQGKFLAGRTVSGNYTDVWRLEYEMLHTDMMYPPCGLWRTKYGKLPELPQ